MIEVVTSVLRARAHRAPDGPFVRCGGEWITSGGLDEVSDRLAAGLARLGFAKGDRIALIMPNRQEMVELFFACAKLGAVQVPLNYWLKGEFLRYQLKDSGARLLIADRAGLEAASPFLADTDVEHVIHVDPGSVIASASSSAYVDLLETAELPPPVEVTPTDIASINYTSGTTGLPKGCMLPHAYYVVAAKALGAAGWVTPGDRVFTTYPLFHMSGVHELMAALVNDASVVFDAEFHASTFIQRAAEEGATVIAGVGPMAMAILSKPVAASDRRHSFRLAKFIPLKPERQKEFEGRFGVPIIAEGYGQTECSPATLNALDGTRKRTTAGKPLAHLDIRVVDSLDRPVPTGEIGEIVIRPNRPDVMFLGYWRDPEATLAVFRNLWHHTGDYGTFDDDGFLTFVDRKKDSLRRRGENVSSFELEAAILQHPSVAQVAVSAVPSSLGEDDIKASIVCHPDTTLEPHDLFEFFKSTLPYFAIPRFVDVRSSLPTNVLGRVMKQSLRDEPVSPTMWDLEALNLTVARDERRGVANGRPGGDRP